MSERTVTIKQIDTDSKTGKVRVRFPGGHTLMFGSKGEFAEWADRDTRPLDEDRRQACRKVKADDPTLSNLGTIIDKEYAITDATVEPKAVQHG